MLAQLCSTGRMNAVTAASQSIKYQLVMNISCVTHVAQMSAGTGLCLKITLDDLNMSHLAYNHTHPKHTQI